jgi:hypothetical protein
MHNRTGNFTLILLYKLLTCITQLRCPYLLYTWQALCHIAQGYPQLTPVFTRISTS